MPLSLPTMAFSTTEKWYIVAIKTLATLPFSLFSISPTPVISCSCQKRPSQHQNQSTLGHFNQNWPFAQQMLLYIARKT
jgi:hypothetical protein